MGKKLKSILNFSFLNRKKKDVLFSSSEGSCVLDAVPDTDRKSSNIRHGNSPRNSESSNDERFLPKEYEDENVHSQTDPEAEYSEKENFNRKFNNKSKENVNNEKIYTKTENIFNLNNSTGIHFGNVINVNNHINLKQTPASKGKKKEKIPDEVKALFQCKDKIEDNYLAFLSTHFGRQWNEIGSFLKLSRGELEEIEKNFSNNTDRGLEMLVQWNQQQHQEAVNIGVLCQLLWDSKVKNAREAVEQLSSFIQVLN